MSNLFNQKSFYLSVTFGILCFLSCGEEMKKTKKVIYQGPASEQYDVELNFTDSARTVLKLITPVQLTLENQNKIYPKKVEIFFHERSTGMLTATMTGDSAKYLKTENIYLVTGHVVIKTQKNETLKTDEITWKIDKKIITTDKPVELETPKEKLYGTGMDANQDFTQYTLRNPRGTVQVDNFPQ